MEHGESSVKTFQIEVPEQLANEVEGLVRAGWFASEAEITRLALTEFVHRHRFELQEQFQRDDIRWALSSKMPGFLHG
jgi:Arc/MetJ-type ribon-helix-helix transcriptional regulator